MNPVLRFMLVLSLASLMVTVVQASGWAGLWDSSRTSVNIGPLSDGPVVSHGTASFDQTGIESGAAAATVLAGSASKATTAESGSGPTFTYVAVGDNIVSLRHVRVCCSQSGTGLITPRFTGQPACPVGQTGYYVYDPNGLLAGLVCAPNATPAPTSTARALAEAASSRQPWPRLTVGINPDVGITGLESWFWLGPGDATVPETSASAGPLTVRVRATLVNVWWDLGDGRRQDSGVDLGRPYPARSSVRHTYQTDTYHRPEGYPVAATLRFGVWYTVSGGPWQFLGTKARTYRTAYRVNQIQPEGVPAQP